MAIRAKWQRGVLGWLTNANVPVFAIDHRRRIRFFNQGCIQQTGLSPERVLGRICEHLPPASEDLLEQLLTLWAAPPEVFEGTSVTRLLPEAAPSQLGRGILFLPLQPIEGELEAILGIVFRSEVPTPNLVTAHEQNWHSLLTSLMLQQRRQSKLPFLAVSPARVKVWQQAQLAARGMIPVYLHGPSGCGKQFLARCIHQLSELTDRPFVPVECRVPANEDLILRLTRNIIAPSSHSESRELPGAVLLKNPDALSSDLIRQVLNSWQDRPDSKPLLMFSSIFSIDHLAQRMQLEESITSQLSTLTLSLPALCETPAEIPLLSHQFVVSHNSGKEHQIAGIESSLLNELREYHWPGNVRELKTFLNQAAEQCQSRELQRDDMPVEYLMAMDAHRVVTEDPLAPLELVLRQAERQHLQTALQRYGTNKTLLAQALGLSRPKLYRLLEDHGLGESSSDSSEASS